MSYIKNMPHARVHDAPPANAPATRPEAKSSVARAGDLIRGLPKGRIALGALAVGALASAAYAAREYLGGESKPSKRAGRRRAGSAKARTARA